MPANKKKININLLLQDEIRGDFTGQLISWALTYGRYIIIITQIFVLSVFFLRFKLDRDYTDLKESVAQKQALIESVSDLEKEVRQTQTRLSHVRQITTNQQGLLQVIRFLQQNVPSTTVFSSLTLTPEKMSLTAVVANLREFSFLLSTLQKNNKFSEVTLEDLSRRGDGRVGFRITAKVNLKAFL